MTRVDFYVLPDNNQQERWTLVCLLAEKAWQQRQRVYIHTTDSEAAASIDEALWQFRSDSFIPHATVPAVQPIDSVNEPIAIGCGDEPDSGRTVLINLAHDVPPFFSRFERTLEIVNQQEQVRTQARVRYSFYQQRGYPLKHHRL